MSVLVPVSSSTERAPASSKASDMPRPDNNVTRSKTSGKVQCWVIYVWRIGAKEPLKFFPLSYRCGVCTITDMSLNLLFQNASFHLKEEWHTYEETTAKRAQEQEYDIAAAPVYGFWNEYKDIVDGSEEWRRSKGLRAIVSCKDHINNCIKFARFCVYMRIFYPGYPGPEMHNCGVRELEGARAKSMSLLSKPSNILRLIPGPPPSSYIPPTSGGTGHARMRKFRKCRAKEEGLPRKSSSSATLLSALRAHAASVLPPSTETAPPVVEASKESEEEEEEEEEEEDDYEGVNLYSREPEGGQRKLSKRADRHVYRGRNSMPCRKWRSRKQGR